MTFGIVALVLFSAGGNLQDENAEKARKRLASMKISLDFRETPLTDVVDYFRDMTELNFLIDPDVLSRGDLPVTILLKKVTVRSALSLFLKPLGLTWIWKDGVLLITDRARGYRVLKLRIYDVRDLLYPIRDFPGVDLQLSDNSIGTTFTDDDDEEAEILPLTEILETHTGGKTWSENSKTSLSLANGLLVVRQSSEVHLQIRRLLAKLRRNK